MIKLTKEQELLVLDAFQQTPNILEITQIVFKDEKLDGRSKEGKAVAKFLARNGLKAITRKKEKLEDIILTKDQLAEIEDLKLENFNTCQIANSIFKKDVEKLSKEWRAVNDIVNKDKQEERDTCRDSSGKYLPPHAISRLIKKINDSSGYGLEERRLSRNQKLCCEKLRINLSNSRFVAIVNNYEDEVDKELFEQEFIRLTWDKPDLTADEINLYMNVSKEIINLESITKNLQKLNGMFESAEDQDEMTVRLAEIIKAKSSEYHQCESRIENLTKKLQGDRGARLANKEKSSSSFLSVVQTFQEEEERQNMVKIAEAQKQLIKEEALRLEGMSAWKARVLGIGIEDVL